MGGSRHPIRWRKAMSNPASSPRGGRPGGATTTKPPRFQSFADLIREAYGTKRKRLRVTKAELEAINSGSKSDAQRDELLHLSASDRTLERTRELMLLSAERFGSQPLAGQVRDYVRYVLRRHPAFLPESLAGVLENLPESASEEAAVTALASQ